MKKRGIFFMLSGGMIYLVTALLDSFVITIPNYLYGGLGIYVV